MPKKVAKKKKVASKTAPNTKAPIATTKKEEEKKDKKKILIPLFCFLGVAALAGAGVGIYFAVSSNNKTNEKEVKLPEDLINEGVTLSNPVAKIGEEYKTKINVDTEKSEGKVLPAKLDKVTSGEKELDPTKNEYTYTLGEDSKSADFVIPAENVVGEVKLSFKLANPTPPSPIDDPTISMSYRYTENENTVKFNIMTEESEEISVFWGEGEVETKTTGALDPEGTNFEHTYSENRDYQIDIEGAVGCFNVVDMIGGEGYFASGNQHIVSVKLYKEFTLPSSYPSLPCSFGAPLNVENPTFSDIESIFVGKDVETIPSYAFCFCDDIKYITIEDGLKNIMSVAFAYSRIDNLVIPYTVEEIGVGAFWGKEGDDYLHSLQSVSIENTPEHPSELKTISYEAFLYTNISSFIVPKSVQTIDEEAFAACEKITSFTFEEDSVLKNLGGSAFYGDTAITELHLPDSLGGSDATAGDKIFGGWTNAQTIYVPFADGETPTGWSSDWNDECGANIEYSEDPITKDYLTLTCLSDTGSLSVTYWYDIAEPWVPNLEYSINDGAWTDFDLSTVPPYDDTPTPICTDLTEGDIIKLRGDNPNGFNYYHFDEMRSHDGALIYNFVNGDDDNFAISGSIASLIDKENYSTLETYPDYGCFACLFEYSRISDASGLDLSVDALTEACYYSLFDSTPILSKCPSLPASSTTLAADCYNSMFSYSNISECPALPATTLAPYCYSWMFAGCENVTVAPVLNAAKMEEGCYSSMFDSTSLEEAPVLDSMQLAPYCYDGMLRNTDITTAPNLPATELKRSCYGGLFMDCDNLTVVPELKAQEMAPYCYSSMFYNSGITTAPDLTCITDLDLDEGCFSQMYQHCQDLETIDMTFPFEEIPKKACYQMFYQCDNITVAPDFSATKYGESACEHMFYECTALAAPSTLPAQVLNVAQSSFGAMFESCGFTAANFTTSPSTVPLEDPILLTGDTTTAYNDMFYNGFIATANTYYYFTSAN